MPLVIDKLPDEIGDRARCKNAAMESWTIWILAAHNDSVRLESGVQSQRRPPSSRRAEQIAASTDGGTNNLTATPRAWLPHRVRVFKILLPKVSGQYTRSAMPS